jgi:hypothetical protein
VRPPAQVSNLERRAQHEMHAAEARERALTARLAELAAEMEQRVEGVQQQM